MNDKYIVQCINAAEMGLTQEQTSELLEIPYDIVQRLTKEFNIKFLFLGGKANERRNNNRKNNIKRASFIKPHDNRSKPETKTQLKTKTRGNTSFTRYDPEQHTEKYLRDLIASAETPKKKIQLYDEITYSYKLIKLREKENETAKGPKIPIQKAN